MYVVNANFSWLCLCENFGILAVTALNNRCFCMLLLIISQVSRISSPKKVEYLNMWQFCCVYDSRNVQIYSMWLNKITQMLSNEILCLKTCKIEWLIMVLKFYFETFKACIESHRESHYYCCFLLNNFREIKCVCLPVILLIMSKYLFWNFGGALVFRHQTVVRVRLNFFWRGSRPSFLRPCQTWSQVYSRKNSFFTP